MHLISVQSILDIENHDVHPEAEIIRHFNDDELAGTEYGILSHCWGAEKEEVEFRVMVNLPKMKKQARNRVRQQPGYKKIVETCKQAWKDGLDWVWVDTCCINKESSAELSEAINSMYRWYEEAKKCYAYLHDLQGVVLPTVRDERTFKDTDGWPKWFSRGWTLQELIAPKDVLFFNAGWQQLEKGTKTCLASTIWKITGIPVSILRHGLDSDRPSTAQIMCWAADRKTTRVEDRAYSLMGLFRIYMPMLYGEGSNAFQRLQLEIIRRTNDHSIFAWRGYSTGGSVLAKDPSDFEGCSDVVRMEPEEYRRIIEENIAKEEITEERLRTCSVTNGGIQIWLPIRRDGFMQPSRLCLHAGILPDPFAFSWCMLMGMHLSHFKLNDSITLRQGFVRENTYPSRETSVTETISTLDGAHTVVSYFNKSANTRFAVVFGLIAGQVWAHLTVPRPGSSSEIEDYAECVWSDMSDSGPKRVAAITRSGKSGKNYCQIKHLHLPRSISDIRLTLQSLPQRNTHSITLDIIQCPGGCVPNHRWQSFDTAHVCEHCMLGNIRVMLDKKISGTLLVDGIPTVFAQTLTQEVELGDYGHWNEDNKCFKWEGNIFKQPTTAFRPDLRLIEHEIHHPWGSYNDVGCIKMYSDNSPVLRRPRGLSLPNDEHISDLLHVLSTSLQGRCLVTTVIQCSELHICGPCLGHTWPNYDHPDDPRWKSVPISVPLFIPTKPLLWCRQGTSGETRRYFEEIRNQFNILSNEWDYPPADVKAAVSFLSNLFIGELPQDYIGAIECFRSVASVRSAQTGRCQSVESDKGCRGIQLQSLGTSSDEWLGQVGVTCRRPRIDSLANRLVQRIPIGMDGSIDGDLRRECYSDVFESAEQVASKGFGPEMLQIIATTYQRPWMLQQEPEHQEQCDGDDQNKEENYVDYDSIKLLIQEIETLQTQLNACTDEDERRALEEDITGKILLACWRGVQGELKQVLTKASQLCFMLTSTHTCVPELSV